MGGTPPLLHLKRYTLSDGASPPLAPGPNRTASPSRLTPSMAPSGGKLRKTSDHNNSSTSIASLNSNNTGRLGGGGDPGAGRTQSPGRNARTPVPTLPGPGPNVVPDTGAGESGAAAPTSLPATGKYPTTFAEMGFTGAKVDEKECIIM